MTRRPPGPGHSPGVARFASLFAGHYETVLAYATRRAPIDTAEDVVADTFLTAWRRLEEVPADELPWLLGVARRVLANTRRSARRQQALVLRIASQRDPSRQDPAEGLANGSIVRAALARLSEGDREILMLVAWEGLNAERAGLVLGCSANAAAVRLHRARRRLAHELAKLEDAVSLADRRSVTAHKEAP